MLWPRVVKVANKLDSRIAERRHSYEARWNCQKCVPVKRHNLTDLAEQFGETPPEI